MTHIDEDRYNSIFKKECLVAGNTESGGIIFAKSDQEALIIARAMVRDIRKRIRENFYMEDDEE